MRRALSWLLTLIVALAAVVGLIAFFNSRDQSSLSATPGKQRQAAGPGDLYRGDPVLSPADRAAVERGNVVVLFRDAKPPAGTSGLIPPGGAALVAAGQSVVLDREPTLKTALAAVSSKRIQPANAPQELQPFIDYWLGG